MRELRDRLSEGLTLLEVMVAVAVLALALTALYSSEAGAVRASVRARNLTVATLLGRCKMAELEEKILREGLPAIEAHGEDGCCEDAEVEGFECRWRIERIELPDALDAAEDEAEEGGGGVADLLGGPGAQEASAGLEAMLQGEGGADALSAMAFAIGYPVLKPVLEEQVRRATVTVLWKEGRRERSFDVVRFFVSAQTAGEAPEEDGDAAR